MKRRKRHKHELSEVRLFIPGRFLKAPGAVEGPPGAEDGGEPAVVLLPTAPVIRAEGGPFAGIGPFSPRRQIYEKTTKKLQKIENLRGPQGASAEPPGTPEEPPGAPETLQKPFWKPPKTSENPRKPPGPCNGGRRKSTKINETSKISGDLWEPPGTSEDPRGPLGASGGSPEAPRGP